ncbi:hypothetical protein LCGC14_0425750 [marine sediment metagenome]|uniref:Uncharacterized protein n=1 Tax=marine sediment metagenome TaxID=412755 RepID=A0A0F9VYZ4_9ZZZZ
MPDRVNLHHEELLSVLQDILRALKQQSTYLQNGGNLWFSGDASAAIGVSGALGGISVLHDFVGSVAAVANVSGDMLSTRDSGMSAAIGSASGGINIAKDLQAAAAAVGGASGILVYVYRVSGTVAAVSTVSGAITVTNKNLAGSVSAVSLVPTVQLFINGIA